MFARTFLALLVSAAAMTACGGQENQSGAAADKPEKLLSCADGKMVATTVGDDGSSKETRSPQEQAAAFAAVQAGAFAGAQKVAYDSEDRVNITFSDASGRVTAVMSYENGDLGWRLREALSCP